MRIALRLWLTLAVFTQAPGWFAAAAAPVGGNGETNAANQTPVRSHILTVAETDGFAEVDYWNGPHQ